MTREAREFRRLECLCREQARQSSVDLARVGLERVAEDCRLAAEAIERDRQVRALPRLRFLLQAVW
ncbi:MAG: hypothetical protein HY852_03910 [Bradyrhizobium sp.]|uniref:hypothetical protein n=1 Tax=Bradyrhizobium sp. TaxID=376 RepID=UPI0025BFAC24|nr:hypothetical protein [Bradyrhizobium sp.]MBI5260948.1 hypothetical protein [Bradyrhizobium sp.]